MTATEVRLALIRHGYTPVPLFFKEPAPKEWQKLDRVSSEQIAMWAKTWPDARNTGCLTRLMPALDIDILDQDAAIAVEDLARERFEERGWLLTRIGKPPKRAIPFRTISPFSKISVNLTAPNGSAEKLEFLADRQQLVVAGIHPETRAPYHWHGGEPWSIRRDELPYICEDEARTLINDAVSMLSSAFGYTHGAAAPKSNGIRPGNGGEALWKFHLDNIRAGRGLHNSITQLAAMLIRSGMDKGAAVHLLAALLEMSETSHDERWEARYRYVPRAVNSAIQKWGTQA